MCGRFTLTQDFDQLAERFELNAEALPGILSYNRAPGQRHPIIFSERREVTLMEWGLIPKWGTQRLINARAESLASKRSFSGLLQRRRCLVPADGFYEWRNDQSKKWPQRFTLRGGGLFAFAGLWDEWEPSCGSSVYTFTIVTTEANSVVAPVHKRMPVILKEEREEEWLCSPEPLLKELLIPYPSEAMEAYPVSDYVNSWKHDDPQCIQRLGW